MSDTILQSTYTWANSTGYTSNILVAPITQTFTSFATGSNISDYTSSNWDVSRSFATSPIGNDNLFVWIRPEDYDYGIDNTWYSAFNVDKFRPSTTAPVKSGSSIVFNGTGYFSRLFTQSVATTTVFVVAKTTSSGIQGLISFGTGTNTLISPSMMLGYPSAYNLVVMGGSSAHRVMATATNNTKFIASYSFTGSNFYSASFNGTNATFTVPPFAGSLGNNILSSPTMYIGADPAGDNGVFNGSVYEIICYNKILTTEETNMVYTYLQNKHLP